MIVARLALILGAALSVVGCVPPDAPTPPEGPTTGRAPLPVEITIPTIRAESSLIPIGLNTDGTLAVPPVDQPRQAAWYEDGPRPGEDGPAVIVGHVDGLVDGRAGQPGVFHRLGQLQRGDAVTVLREDRSTVTFRVYRVQRVAKDTFPTWEVYGPTAGPELRLITCSGVFDRAARSYRDNTIVYATADGRP